MGTGYGFTCTNCGYEKEFLEGQGFAVHDQTVKEYLKDLAFSFHPKTHRKIEKLADIDKFLEIHCEYQTWLCEHCNLPFTKLYVEVSDHDHIFHQSHFRCSRCNRPLVQAEIMKRETFRCPKCLHETLKFNGSDICWD